MVHIVNYTQQYFVHISYIYILYDLYLVIYSWFFVWYFRSIGCVKSFVPLGSQNGLSGVDPLQSPKAWHPLWY